MCNLSAIWYSFSIKQGLLHQKYVFFASFGAISINPIIPTYDDKGMHKHSDCKIYSNIIFAKRRRRHPICFTSLIFIVLTLTPLPQLPLPTSASVAAVCL